MQAKPLVRFLNAHHVRYCAGFYPSNGGRGFGARIHKGEFQITRDFRTFESVPTGTEFRDHNGRTIAKLDGVQS